MVFSHYLLNRVLEKENSNNLTTLENHLLNNCFNQDEGVNILGVEKNWGILIFKPPRASLYLMAELKKALLSILEKKKIKLLGQYEVKALTKEHIFAMYPGDSIMPYWPDLESKLLYQPAFYFLVSSNESKDLFSEIELIKGWYKIDVPRGRFSKQEGLRAIFRQLVEKHEGFFEEILPGSKEYEDSGIHAPCSFKSRLFQLLGFMVVDSYGAEWARSCLKWLNELKSGEV